MRAILTAVIIFLAILIFRILFKEKSRLQSRATQKERAVREIDRCAETLGLKPGVSKEELEQAYKDLVNVWHPDRFTNNPRLQQKAQEKLKEINTAYEYIRSFYRWK